MQPITALCWSVIIGALPLAWQASLPPIAVLQAVTIAGCLLAGIRHVRWLGLLILCGCWAQFAAQQAVAPIATMTHGLQRLDVTITRVDSGGRHEIRAWRHDGRWLFPAQNIHLRGWRLPESLCVGQRWRLMLSLRPVHAQLNDGGFDRQRYALANHQVLDGWVQSAEVLDRQCSLRGRLIHRAQQMTSKWRWQAVMLALIFGERQQLSIETRRVMRETGTAHLMAISGLHIAIAASMGIWLARGGQWLMPARRITPLLPLLSGLLGAAIYTWLAGAGPPTLRALLAMGVWSAIRLKGRLWTTWQVWLCCVALLIASDPLIILSDSFRLSVMAVAGLIAWFQWAVKPPFLFSGRWRAIGQLIWLQLGIELLILPGQVVLFHGVSLFGGLANLVAVPWVSFITLPLLFAAVCLTAWPVAANLFWGLADRSLAAIFRFLHFLPPGWLDIDACFIWLALLPWPLLVYWRLGLWRHYWAPGAGVLALACLPWLQPPPRGWSLHMLDVGHGLAMVIVRNQQALIFDTGNAWPGGSYARSTIIPWLRWHHLTPTQVIISHEHQDHIGGLADLWRAWPQLVVISPLGRPGHSPCHRGLHWQWQGLRLDALWPLKGQRVAGNNGSCVVLITDGHHRMLLTGDIERQAEQELQRLEGENLRATLMQVPHHGSATSSTPGFLRRAGPGAALASAARYNRWHLPVASVVTRYRRAGYQWWDTGRHGQISVYFLSDESRIVGFRPQISARWFHQWFGDDPLNR